jgi:microcin C transport system permease protein
LRNIPVLTVIVGKLPISIWFGIWSLLLTYGVCIPLGIVKAIRHRTNTDNFTSIALFIGYALPGYILAVVFQYFFAFHWHIFPHSGFAGDGLANAGFWAQLGDRLWHTALPLVCLTSGSFALMTMLMKNTLLDNLALDYVRTAVAKGVSFRDAVIKHAFRNSLVPIATSFGNCLAALLTGSFLIEKIFDIDGIGLLSFNSLVGRDYPVFLGLLTCSSFLLLLGNILSDLCVALVDPRIRFEK